MERNRKRRRRITRKFIRYLLIFTLIVGLGLIFEDQYVRVRTVVRASLKSTVFNIVSAVREGDPTLLFPRLLNGTRYADLMRLTGRGERVDEDAVLAPTDTGTEYIFDEVRYPFRAMLNDDAKAIYNQVYAHAVALDRTSFTLVKRTSESVLQTIMSAVYNDHPELFFIDTAYTYGYLAGGDVISVKLSYSMSDAEIADAKKRFDDAVYALMQGAAVYGNNLDKERYVHDALIESCDYDPDAPMHQSAYSALVLGRSVCAGYSRAFQHVLSEIGIPCYYVTGQAADGDHAWNIAVIDGVACNVDVSWNDTSGNGNVSYRFFNLSDAAFSADHTRDEMSSRLPNCAGLSAGSALPTAVHSEPDLRTFSSLGFSAGDALATLNEYNRCAKTQIVSRGIGEYTFNLLVRDKSLLSEIYAALEKGDYLDDYARPAVEALRLKNARITVNLSGETLMDGYILLKQTVHLDGEAAPDATPSPSPSPEPPSPTPTHALETPDPSIVFDSPEPSPTPDPLFADDPDVQGGDPNIPENDLSEYHEVTF